MPILWCGIGAAAVVLFLLGAAWLLLTPPPEAMAPPLPADVLVQQRVFAKLSGEVFRRDPPAESELRLTAAEVASLLRFAGFAVTAAEYFGSLDRRVAERIRAGRCSYSAGVFSVEFPLCRPAPRWLFGGAVVVRAEGFPSKYDSRIDFAVRSCRIGRLPLPASWVEAFANRRFGDLPGREGMLRFDRAVKNFEPEGKGGVIVIYRPPELLRLLAEGLR